ncbi:MAG: ABC transporter permease [Acidobacteria bacterium]|nr:ABC transporter permease [Acidobacteriota bacterium]
MTPRPRAPLVLLALLHAALLFAGFLAPYDYDEQHRDFSYAAPSWHARAPGGSATACRVVFLSGGRLFAAPPPCGIFLLGTDAFGRDVFSRVLYGGRISVLAGISAMLLALGIGTAAGTLAGYFGGWTDRLLMRAGELFLALPWLYLLLAVRAALPLNIPTTEAFLLVVAIVGSLGWVRPARLIRGVVLSVRERPYVEAARGFGASPAYLIRRHILPEIRGVILTQATLLIPQFILAEVTLSFLGLGIGEPVPSWGNMLAEARQYFALVDHAWLLAPGLLLIPLLLGYFLLADRWVDRDVSRGSQS